MKDQLIIKLLTEYKITLDEAFILADKNSMLYPWYYPPLPLTPLTPPTFPDYNGTGVSPYTPSPHINTVSTITFNTHVHT